MWLFEQNMNGHPHRRRMYNRLLPNRSGYAQEFLNGVNQFDEFACRQTDFQNWGGGIIDVHVLNAEIEYT